MLSQIMEVLTMLAFVSIVTEMRQLDLAKRGVHLIVAMGAVEFMQPREWPVNIIDTDRMLGVIQQGISK